MTVSTSRSGGCCANDDSGCAGAPVRVAPIAHVADACCDTGCATSSVSMPARDELSTGTVTYRIADMDCPVEEAQVRRALQGLSDVAAMRFDLPARTLEVEAPEAALEAVEAAIRALGFQPLRQSPRPPSETVPPASTHLSRLDGPLLRLGVALVLAVVAEALAWITPQSVTLRAIGMTIAVAAIALSGSSVYRKGWSSMLRGRLTMNTLMSVAATGAFLIGQWPEAAMVMALYGVAEVIEARSAERARRSIRDLMKLAPSRASVLHDGQWREVDTATIGVGQVVRTRPGERLALDGVVVSGSSSVDQSPVTGESLPVTKTPGDIVHGGTVNGEGELQVRVTAPASRSLVARIIQQVESAQAARAPTQRFVDRFAEVYTPAVFAAAVAVAVIGPWLAGWSRLDAVYRALVLLVIGCPCALVLSTPVTVVSALSAAARRGVLVKGGAFLEAARQVRTVAFDKTGTLTEGLPRLVDMFVADGEEVTLRSIAKGLASRSDHPVSVAVAQGLAGEAVAFTAFEAVPGRGIVGTHSDGRRFCLGSHRWALKLGLATPVAAEFQTAQEDRGRTTVVLMSDDRIVAAFAVSDVLKDSAVPAVRALHALGVRTVLLSGDSQAASQFIGAQAGIEDIRGELLPADKAAAVAALSARGAIAMVGDGINDAPALARADLGIAMGAGTDIAMEAADVVVMNDDPTRVAELLSMSRRAGRVLRQNIALALGIKLVFLALALTGTATLWMAVFADMGASLLVVFNGLRLNRTRR